MRFIFVRHGEPDYAKDCLTERGKLQAAAAAERLQSEGIKKIYSSPMGRAYETAGFTARKLGLPITVLDYMHEISWGGEGMPEEGHPWTLAERMMEEGFTFSGDNWREHPYFKGNAAVEYYDMISGKIDHFLEEHGYRHEGGRYLCLQAEDTLGGSGDGRKDPFNPDETIALFSHGGSGACALAHLLGLPFPYVCTVLPYDFTSVIILEFPARPGEYVRARLELFNDAAHIRDISSGLVIQQKADPVK